MHDNFSNSLQLHLEAHRKIWQTCGFSEILSILRDSDAFRIYTISIVMFPKFLRLQNGTTFESVTILIFVKFFLMESLVYFEILIILNAMAL